MRDSKLNFSYNCIIIICSKFYVKTLELTRSSCMFSNCTICSHDTDETIKTAALKYNRIQNGKQIDIS